MKGELREKLDNFLKNIKDTIAKLEKQRNTLKKKLDDEKMTQEEFSEYIRLGKELTSQKDLYEEYKNKITTFDRMKKDINKLTKVSISKKQKDEIIDSLVSYVSYYNGRVINRLIETNPNLIDEYIVETRMTNLKEKLQDIKRALDATKKWSSKNALKRALNGKIRDLKTLETYSHDTTEIEQEIIILKSDLEILEKYENIDIQELYNSTKQEYDYLTKYYNILVNEKSFRESLEKLTQKDITEQEKETILEDLYKLIDTLELDADEQLIKEFNLEEKDNKEKTEETKKSTPIEKTTTEIPKDDKKEEGKKLPEGGKKMEDNRFSFNEDGSYSLGKGSITKEPINLHHNDSTRKMIVKPEEKLIPKPTKNKGIIAKAVCYTLAGVIGVTAVVGAYLIERSSKKTTNGNNITTEYVDPNLEAAPEPMATPVPEVIIAMQNSNPTVVSTLQEIGYSEAVVPFMATSFSEDQIALLEQLPYDARVENYAKCSGFNYNYIDDYENARATQNLTTLEAVDFVNRAHLLQNYNLFNGANINDYTRFVAGIANKDIMTHKNDEVSLALNDVMNEIATHVLDTKITGVSSITNEDLNRIEALREIAAPGSDLDEFLEGFVDIIKACITDPYNIDLSNKAYMYLNLWVKSLNNMDNPLNHLETIEGSLEENVLTVDPVFNERAKIKDANDFVIAWDDIVGPLWFTFVPLGDGNDPEFQIWDELFQTASSARDIVYNQTCGEEMTLSRESGE